jgi:hypothetical protein
MLRFILFFNERLIYVKKLCRLDWFGNKKLLDFCMARGFGVVMEVGSIRRAGRQFIY